MQRIVFVDEIGDRIDITIDSSNLAIAKYNGVETARVILQDSEIVKIMEADDPETVCMIIDSIEKDSY